MDVPSEYRKSSQKRRSKANKNQGQVPPQQAAGFDQYGGQNPQYMQQLGQPDMFYGGPGAGYGQSGYGPQAGGVPQFPGQQLLSDPMANMAMQYGQSLADQGKDMVNKNIEKYVSSSKIKYYFAVDNAYVGKKLGLLFFPYTHSDWSIRYNQDEPIAPRYEINAPDLYIPVMAFVTYVLVAGMVLGTQDRFTPEQLGVQASSALVWLIMELVAFSLSLYIMNLNTGLKYLDIVAFCGYKFVGMTFSLLAGVTFQSMGYYCTLLWFCVSLVFFLVRSLKVQVLPQQSEDGFTRGGGKRSLYLILSVSLVQPLLMWWLTSYVMVVKKV